MKAEQLHQALQLLYDASSRFRVSIETIQRLAKHLTLDTFVDSDTLAPPASRLSIAGQLLLLDVDFTADDAILAVVLSLGTHSLTDSKAGVVDSDLNAFLGSCISSDAVDSDETKLTVLLKQNGAFSFFRNGFGASAEEILRLNLQGPLLGAFAVNLAYLASLDRLSPPEGDLIAVMDKIALYLALVHHTETQNDPKQDVVNGNLSRFGCVQLNDNVSKRIGVFLKFWERNRHLGPSVPYMACLSVQSSQNPVDYLEETQTKPWIIGGKEVVVALDQESMDTFKLNLQVQNWALLVSLDSFVSLPATLVEYLGLNLGTDSANGNEPQNGTFESGEKRILFDFDSSLIQIKQFSFVSLHQLAKIMPALRNQITFSALLQSISDCKVVTDETELLPETSKKIRASLKISDEVPDEELMGLNSIPNDIMGTVESGLEDFMKDEFMEEEDEKKSNELAFSLVQILYDTPNSDYLLRIVGDLTETETIDTHVVISNGEILQYGDVDMDLDILRRFISALSLSEDILLALKAVQD